MKQKYGYSIAKTTLYSNSTCGLPPKDFFNLVRDADSDFPWPGMSFGLIISSVWYWCSDQVSITMALIYIFLTFFLKGYCSTRTSR
jgi:hypothetical protein